MRKRRVWTEFLSAEMLAAPETLALLARHQLQPIIAMPPAREGPQMAKALLALQGAEVPIGLWPLLSDSDGYWPGAANAALVLRRVHELLVFARQAKVKIQTLAFDLEPTLARKQSFAAASTWQRTLLLAARLRESRTASVGQQHTMAVQLYGQLARELRSARIESLAIAVPPLAIDLLSGHELWQQFFGTPLTGPGWDTQSPMYYRSMIQTALPSKSPLWSQALFAEACRIWAQSAGATCMSLGVVGPGKLADETSYQTPSELAWDVACASAAGIEDLALFSLESLLDRPDPEAWLAAFGEAPTQRAVPRPERLARRCVRGGLYTAAILSRWL